jgi:hypothetical protein
VPAGCVTTHTLFCLRTPLPAREQLVLCALFNSYVANYLVRMRVSSHVTLAVLDTLPAPRLHAREALGAERDAVRAKAIAGAGAATPNPSCRRSRRGLRAHLRRSSRTCSARFRSCPRPMRSVGVTRSPEPADDDAADEEDEDDVV